MSLPHDNAVARGCKPYRMVQTEVRFDPEIFERIRFVASCQEINFSAAVRLLVNWGFEAMEAEK